MGKRRRRRKEVVYQSVVSVHGTHMPGLAPAIITMRRAMRLCRFHFSMDAARQMTPISSRVVSLQYSAATLTNKNIFSRKNIWTDFVFLVLSEK